MDKECHFCERKGKTEKVKVQYPSESTETYEVDVCEECIEKYFKNLRK